MQSEAPIDQNVRALFEQAPALINVLMGREGRCEIFNPPLAKWWNFREVLNRPMREAWPELEGSGIFEMVETVFDSGETRHLTEFKTTANHIDGREHTFNFVFSPYRIDGKTAGVMIFGYEVADVIQARAIVEERDRELALMADAMPLLVWIMQSDGTISYSNKRLQEYQIGAQSKRWALHNLVYKDDIAMTEDFIHRALTGGLECSLEHRLVMNDGSVKWHLSKASPHRDAAGVVVKWFGTSTDIHTQKEFSVQLEEKVQKRTDELRHANQMLLHSNKELEQFAYVVSHDLQEPLRKIKSFGDLLKERFSVSLPYQGKDYVDRMQSAAYRMSMFIEGLLTYSRVTRNDHLQRNDLNEVLNHVLEDLGALIVEKNARIEFGKLGTVTGDRLKLGQVFQNLISNALKFSREGVPPHVVLTSRMVKGQDVVNQISFKDANREFLWIEVKDNGIGFEEDQASYLFHLFHRLLPQKQYPGSGVGLAIVKKVVENIGGYVWASGQPDQGATFNLLLPYTKTKDISHE